ncbi:MAG TPA: hypothetical protein VLE70_05850 [Anaerolineae bacterium]|jgi:hypothetical protein|nr:hypothetical protein [Anaerolineae bacterium]
MSLKDDQRKEILQLLATGRITAVEAADLLAGEVQRKPVQENSPESAEQPEPEKQAETAADLDELIKVEPDPALKAASTGSYDPPSWLRVRVSDLKTGRKKVTVNIPMRLMRFGMAVGSRFAPELNDFDWDELTGMLGSEKGMLVDVQDEEDGEHVQIFVD